MMKEGEQRKENQLFDACSLREYGFSSIWHDCLLARHALANQIDNHSARPWAKVNETRPQSSQSLSILGGLAILS